MRPLLTSVLSMVIVTGLAWSTAAHAERRIVIIHDPGPQGPSLEMSTQMVASARAAAAKEAQDAADAGRGEIERCGGSQAPGADDERGRIDQPLLGLDADLVEQDVAAVAQELGVVHDGSVNAASEGGAGLRAALRRDAPRAPEVT